MDARTRKTFEKILGPRNEDNAERWRIVEVLYGRYFDNYKALANGLPPAEPSVFAALVLQADLTLGAVDFSPPDPDLPPANPLPEDLAQLVEGTELLITAGDYEGKRARFLGLDPDLAGLLKVKVGKKHETISAAHCVLAS